MIKLQHTPDMTMEAMTTALTESLPQYEVELKKNPLLGFEYVEVRQSGMVGTWVRLFEKKNEVRLIPGMPAWWARAFFGGLIFFIIFAGDLKRIKEATGDALSSRFSTGPK